MRDAFDSAMLGELQNGDPMNPEDEQNFCPSSDDPGSAATVGHELTLKKLAQLRFRYDLDVPEQYMLARKGRTDELRKLLHGLVAREGPKVVDRCATRTGHCVLHEAACEGRQDTVIMLCEEFGAEVHTRTLMGLDTALHLAAAHGHRRVCFFLMVRFGADPNLRNKYRQCPLHYAEELTTVKTLVKYGGRVTFVDVRGLTPVQCAFQRGATDDLIEFLNDVVEVQERELFQRELDERRQAQEELDRLREEALRAQHRSAAEKVLHNATREYFLWRSYRLPREKKPAKEEVEFHDVMGEFVPGGSRHRDRLQTPTTPLNALPLGPNSDSLPQGSVYLGGAPPAAPHKGALGGGEGSAAAHSDEGKEDR